MRRLTERTAELATEVRGREACGASHVRDGDGLGEVRVGEVTSAHEVTGRGHRGHGATLPQPDATVRRRWRHPQPSARSRKSTRSDEGRTLARAFIDATSHWLTPNPFRTDGRATVATRAAGHLIGAGTLFGQSRLQA